MGMGISDFGSPAWIGALFGIQPIPTGYYIALCSDEPGEAMDGDILSDLEPTGGGYQRRRYGIGAGYWGLGGDFLVSVQDVVIGTADSDWGEINHFALLNAPASGDLYAWGELQNPQYIQSGAYVVLPAGGMVIALKALDAQIAV